jgi:hypothetical protein
MPSPLASPGSSLRSQTLCLKPGRAARRNGWRNERLTQQAPTQKTEVEGREDDRKA